MAANPGQMVIRGIGFVGVFLLGVVFQLAAQPAEELDEFLRFNPIVSRGDGQRFGRPTIFYSGTLTPTSSPTSVFLESTSFSFDDMTSELAAAIRSVSTELKSTDNSYTFVRFPSGREGVYDWQENKLILFDMPPTPLEQFFSDVQDRFNSSRLPETQSK